MFILIIVLIIVAIYFVLAPMPGRIAKRRNHPHTKVIRLCGWTAIFSRSISAWVLALMWAHNNSDEAAKNFEARIELHKQKAKRRNLFRF